MRKLDNVIIAIRYFGFSLAYLTMSKITTDSHVARQMEQTASLKTSAELKRKRNDAASEREHIRILRKLEHEFDGSFGHGGILKRGLARINSNSLTVPAERKRQLISSTSGRAFHGKGTIYRKISTIADGQGRKRSASPGAAHYRYINGTRYEIIPVSSTNVSTVPNSVSRIAARAFASRRLPVLSDIRTVIGRRSSDRYVTERRHQ